MEIDVADHTKLAHLLAHKFKIAANNLHIDYDDLYQVALIGIWKATKKFDPAKGFTFATFASSVAINEIKMHLRRATAGKYQIGNPIGKEDGFMDNLSSRKADDDFRTVDLKLTIRQIASMTYFKSDVKQRIIDCLLDSDILNAEQLANLIGTTTSHTYVVIKALGAQLKLA